MPNPLASSCHSPGRNQRVPWSQSSRRRASNSVAVKLARSAAVTSVTGLNAIVGTALINAINEVPAAEMPAAAPPVLA